MHENANILNFILYNIYVFKLADFSQIDVYLLKTWFECRVQLIMPIT